MAPAWTNFNAELAGNGSINPTNLARMNDELFWVPHTSCCVLMESGGNFDVWAIDRFMAPNYTLLARSNLSPLPRAFYNRDPRIVARALLGKLVLRRTGNGLIGGRIVETEAYLGENDAAAHSTAGRTARNFVLFGPPGHAYVYFIYGNHYCLNVSCLPEGDAGCVLVRALEPVFGIPEMAKNRGITKLPESVGTLKLLTSGPGRLCEALAITRANDNGKELTGSTDLFIADDRHRAGRIVSTPRIGITKAAADELRFVISGNPFVSGKRA